MAAQKKTSFRQRTIKLSYLCYQNPDPFNRTPPKTVPFLRLSGLWLTAAGFHPVVVN